MRKKFLKKNKKIFFIFFILIFNLISICFLPNFTLKNYENSKDDPCSFIKSSSPGPPKENFFNYYKVITIDSNMVLGTGSHRNFPVLISLFDSDLHDEVQLNGNDIAFSDGSVWMDHEIESFERDYNTTHSKLIVWVRLPFLSASSLKGIIGQTTYDSIATLELAASYLSESLKYLMYPSLHPTIN